MKLFLLALLLLTTSYAHSTIWVTLSDPETNKIGVIGASSGYIGERDTVVVVENHGIAVVGSWYLGRRNRPLYNILSRTDLSAQEAVTEFYWLINRGPHSRRVSLVNSRFENAAMPGRGCHNSNYYCGKYEDPFFSITGGGLVSREVILAAKNKLQNPKVQELAFECRLYKAIEAIFHSGGETKTFERVSLLVDDVTVNGDLQNHLFFRKGPEESLLQQVREMLSGKGINCEASP